MLRISQDVVRAAFGAVFNLVTDQGEQAVLPASPRDFVSSMERVPLICGICERETIIAFTRKLMLINISNENRVRTSSQ